MTSLPLGFPRPILIAFAFMLASFARGEEEDRYVWSWEIPGSLGMPLKCEGFLNGAPGAFERRDKFAYVAAGTRFEIWDMTDEERPTVAGSLETGRRIVRMMIEGPAALLVSDGGRLMSVDIRDPAHPACATPYGLGVHTGFFRVGPLLLTMTRRYRKSDAGTEFNIIDLTDPLHPRALTAVDELLAAEAPMELAAFALSPSAMVAVLGASDETTYTSRICVANLADSGHPNWTHIKEIQAQRVDGADRPEDTVMNIKGDAVYEFGKESASLGGLLGDPDDLLAFDFMRFQVWNVLVGHRPKAGGALDWKTVDNGPGEQEEYSPTFVEPGALPKRTPYPILTAFSGIELVGGHALIRKGDTAISVIDVSVPGRLSHKGLFEPGGQFGSFKVDGTRVYFLGESVSVYDFADPTRPISLGSFKPSAPAKEISPSGNRVALQEGDQLEFLDVVDPARPKLLGILRQPCVDFRLVGPRLCWIGGKGEEAGLTITDVLDPSSLRMIKFFPDDADFPERGVIESGESLIGAGTILARPPHRPPVFCLDVADPTLTAFHVGDASSSLETMAWHGNDSVLEIAWRDTMAHGWGLEWWRRGEPLRPDSVEIPGPGDLALDGQNTYLAAGPLGLLVYPR